MKRITVCRQASGKCLGANVAALDVWRLDALCGMVNLYSVNVMALAFGAFPRITKPEFIGGQQAVAFVSAFLAHVLFHI